jgi:NhaP-type Na+/H+ or K+/H+ antiporter
LIRNEWKGLPFVDSNIKPGLCVIHRVQKKATMGDADPIRRLIWSIGNGTSESSLCETLEIFFHTICPLANVLNEEICKDYKHAYEARCAPNAHRLAREGTFLYVAIVLLFCVSLASYLKYRQIFFIPESAVTIVVGFATGTLFVVSNANHSFNEQIFFEILLPFIIFEAGYNMDKRLLGKNFALISSLAIVGTFISFSITTGLMILANNSLDTGLSQLDCAMFGALISSTDPIAIVNVFSSLGINAKLYALVLGESALNDGVAVALYASMKHFYSEPDIADWDAVQYVFSNFLLVSGGSLSLGFAFAAATALFWKIKGQFWFVHPVMETLAFLICAILPYYIADAFHWSGVIAIMATSMGLSVYAHGNLSATAQLHVVFLVECIARLCEAVMFGYVGTQIVVNNAHMVWTPLVLVGFGVVLVARAAAVFPLIGLHNCCLPKSSSSSSAALTTPHQERIPLANQVIVWF